MSDELLVLLGGIPCGVLERRAGGRLRFEYLQEYGELEDATPLSVSMPKPLRSFGHDLIQPWLQGLLPDNDNVLRRWATSFQVPPSAFALLGTPIGEDCAGAVQFVPPDSVRSRAEDEIQWLDEAGVAEMLRGLAIDSAAWTANTSSGQFSLAGAQAKTALICDAAGRWGIPSGSVPTTHILKPAIPNRLDHDLNEHLCLAAASKAGLVSAATEVKRFASETALVVERYDRFIDSGRLVRVHQEDLCQAFGVGPERKYQKEGGPKPGAIADLFRRAMTPVVAEDAVRRFADALIWNWLIGGTDAHAKNYSLVLSGPVVALAPLYDIASLLPYGEHERTMKMAMKVGGSYEVHPRLNRWRRAAVEMGTDPGRLEERVLELATTAPEAFAQTAAELEGFDSDMPSRLTDLVADRCARCTKLIKETKPL